VPINKHRIYLRKGDIMRRLDLKNYTFSLTDQKGVIRVKTYNFKETVKDVLTSHGLGLNGPELLNAMEVALKVSNAKNEVLLDDRDYRLITETCGKFRGFQKFDEQFLKRIYNCPIVPDKEFSDNGGK